MDNNSPSNNGMWSSKRNLFVNDCESSSAWSHKNLKCHKPNKCETRFTNKAPVYHNQNLVTKNMENETTQQNKIVMKAHVVKV
jgi:hypothetical protein